MIVKKTRELKALYHELSGGDVFIGNLSLKYLKQTMLIDMLERDIRCLPSAIAQVLNSSKVAQAFVLKDWMLPFTQVIPRRSDLIDALNTYNRTTNVLSWARVHQDSPALPVQARERQLDSGSKFPSGQQVFYILQAGSQILAVPVQ